MRLVALLTMVLVHALLLAERGSAQSRYQIETGFERDVNRYQWIGRVGITDSFAGWRVVADNRFQSDAFVLFQDRLSFRDENRLSLVAERDLSPLMTLRVLGESGIFSQSRVYSQELYAGLRYRPVSHGWVEARAGAAWDSRPGAPTAGTVAPLRSDAGPAYGGAFYYAPPSIQGYNIRMRGESGWQIIAPRRGRMVRFSGAAERSFDNTAVQLLVDLASFRRDAYQAVSFLNRDATDGLSETIEATTSDTLAAALRVQTPLTQHLRVGMDLQFDAMNRSVEAHNVPSDALFFDTAFRRRSFEAQGSIAYESPAANAHLAITTGAEVERRRLENRDELPPAQAAQKANVLRQADYDHGHVALLLRGNASLGRFTASFDGTTSILRHDTPDLNPDDRDELYQHALVGLMYRLSRYLEVDVRVFGTRYHTVYLNAVRSAENNVQRSLRLRPSVRWRPSSATRIEFGSEVRATYTVDDFLLAGRRPKDQSARELRYDAALEHDFGQGLILRASGSVSDLHLGRLLWTEFAEIPFDTLRTYSAWVHLQAGTRIIADVGVRMFIRSDFDRATSVRYPRVDADGAPVLDANGMRTFTSISRPGRTSIEQIGPTCSITWPLMDRSRLRLDGWLNVQRIRHRLFGDLPEGQEGAITRAASRGDVRVIPNVALSVLWTL